MANLKLVSSEYNSVALYYILTSIEEVVTNGAEVEGNLPLVAGSLAYDKFQQVYCFDGELWGKANGSIALPVGTYVCISDHDKPATIQTTQYMTYDFGGNIINDFVQEDPTGYLKAYVLYDGKLYELEKKSFNWGVTVPYFGADPSGTYPALSFDFSVYPFAVVNLNGDVALVVPNDPVLGYEQVHTLFVYVFGADS